MSKTRIEHGVIASSTVLDTGPKELRDSPMRVFTIQHEHDATLGDETNLGDIQLQDTVPFFPQFDEDGNTYLIMYNYHYEAYDIHADSKETAVVIKWDADLNVVWVRELYAPNFQSAIDIGFVPRQLLYVSGRLYAIGSGDSFIGNYVGFNPDQRATIIELDKNTGAILNAKNFIDKILFDTGDKTERTDSWDGYMRNLVSDGTHLYFPLESASRFPPQTTSTFVTSIVKVDLNLNVVWNRQYLSNGSDLGLFGLLQISDGFLYSGARRLLKIDASTGQVIKKVDTLRNIYGYDYNITGRIQDIKISSNFIFITIGGTNSLPDMILKLDKDTLELLDSAFTENGYYLYQTADNKLVLHMWYPSDYRLLGAYAIIDPITLKHLRTEYFVGHAYWCNSYDINPVTNKKVLCSYATTAYNSSIVNVAFIDANSKNCSTNKSTIGDNYNSELEDITYSAENFFRYFTVNKGDKVQICNTAAAMIDNPAIVITSVSRELIVLNSGILSRPVNSIVNTNSFPSISDDKKTPDERLDNFLNQVVVFTEI